MYDSVTHFVEQHTTIEARCHAAGLLSQELSKLEAYEDELAPVGRQPAPVGRGPEKISRPTGAILMILMSSRPIHTPSGRRPTGAASRHVPLRALRARSLHSARYGRRAFVPVRARALRPHTQRRHSSFRTSSSRVKTNVVDSVSSFNSALSSPSLSLSLSLSPSLSLL